MIDELPCGRLKGYHLKELMVKDGWTGPFS